MSFPASANALVPVIQATDTPPAETVTIPSSGPYTYRLGANASPALPAGLQRIPKVVYPLDAPGVISASSDITSKGHFLTPSSVYKYALTNVTRQGETTADNVYTAPATGATATDSTGKLLTLPAVTASTSNPVISRRLYRTVAGGTPLKWCADIDDLSLTSWTDGKADDDLGVAPPGSNGSGVGVSPAAVTISGGGYGSWTQKAPGATLSGGDYIVDGTYTADGGTITFAAADAGKVVTVTYVNTTTFVNAALFNALVTAIKDIAAATHIQPSTASNAAMADYSANYAPLGTLTDARGSFTMATASGAAFVRFTFHDAYPATPIVTVTPLDAATAAAQPYVSARSTTGFTVTMGIPGTTGTTFNLEYLVVA